MIDPGEQSDQKRSKIIRKRSYFHQSAEFFFIPFSQLVVYFTAHTFPPKKIIII